MDHEATLRRMYDSINSGNVDAFAEPLADDFVDHELPPDLAPTKAGTKEFIGNFLIGFPDTRFDAEDVLSSGDKVVARVQVTGTHSGTYMGIPATGKSIKMQGIDILRFADDGLVHEHWGVMDVMAMMQQLGVVPEGPPQ
jgi:steroid delta-isomerase-like uncharacterized protein